MSATFCQRCGAGTARESAVLHRASDNMRMYQYECSVCGFRGHIFEDREVALGDFLARGRAEREKEEEMEVV